MNDRNNSYKNIEEYNPKNKCKILVVFGDMIAVMLIKKNLNPIISELFIRGRKLTIYLVFITKSFFFAVPKNIRQSSMHYFIINIMKYELSTFL